MAFAGALGVLDRTALPAPAEALTLEAEEKD